MLDLCISMECIRGYRLSASKFAHVNGNHRKNYNFYVGWFASGVLGV